jgi:hypothetical protein
MNRVVVTVKRQGEAQVRDLELPNDLETGRLMKLISEALRWETDAAGQPIDYEMEAHPLGRMLKPDETLKSAGVWDGSWLVLRPVGHTSSVPHVSHSAPPVGGPVVGWRSLGTDVPGSSSQPPSPDEETGQETGKGPSKFVWRQIT